MLSIMGLFPFPVFAQEAVCGEARLHFGVENGRLKLSGIALRAY
jgi:hypothetical protein